ncbi:MULTISPECIES: amino acid ABC transporter permease [Rhodomicrobium]|uniref:amino acid ABC transporter permease n=1 Tax=Rhodomicrobium TaxID=1068 RepID=UPI000B4B69CA|nr:MULTISPECIES: amino acid ABC transporter permease [Rhodomicrobium]
MTPRRSVSAAIPGSAAPRPAPASASSTGLWLRRNLIGSVQNTILTLLALWALFVTLPNIIDWAILSAVWHNPDSQACRDAAGACWAVVAEKHRVMLFGTFPYDQHWRAVAVIVIVVGMAILSAFRRFWSYRLFAAWLAATAVIFILLLGGIFGLTPVGTHQWGGLPLTLVLFAGTVVGGLPAGVLLALGRRSSMPAIRAVCTGFIEIVRGLPLITVLFMASLMVPLFLPEGVSIDKFLRAQIAMTGFFAAYAAEVVRGGLQAIPRGQYEAADAIGLGFWQATGRIVLPQALRIVLPALMNEIIRAFKNTTFVSIVGLFDVLRATSTALQDPLWGRFAIEAYLFIFALYFVFCFSMSAYSRHVERDLAEGRNL